MAKIKKNSRGGGNQPSTSGTAATDTSATASTSTSMATNPGRDHGSTVSETVVYEQCIE